jgi:hypothetical protein
MMFLYAYIGFSILTFVMMYMQAYIVCKKLERQYPGIVREYKKRDERGILEKIFSYIKNFVICFIPIMNICIFYVALFENKNVEERTLNEIQNDTKEV